MKFVRKILTHNRVRQAKRRLAEQPSPRNYAALANEHAWEGNSALAVQVCREGLEVFPGSSELQRLFKRVLRVERENRISELKSELVEAPRPALWGEMCDVLLESGQLDRAEETAQEWYEETGDPDAVLVLARTRVSRFLDDRGREQGQKAFEALDRAQECLERDPRPWRLRLELCSKIGAAADARQCVVRLLELEPGEPSLEARFRVLSAQSENAPPIERALIEVERTGKLHEEEDTGEERRESQEARDVRPALQRLASEEGVHAALYIRGSTALVQGPRGATAERAARSVRGVTKSARTVARRLGLGQVASVTLEGNFGTFAVATGEMDAGALWCSGQLLPAHAASLLDLAGVDATVGEASA